MFFAYFGRFAVTRQDWQLVLVAMALAGALLGALILVGGRAS